MFGTKKHFSLEQFHPFHDRPVTFIVSQWQHDKTRPNIKYLIYRHIISLTFFISWLVTLTNTRNNGNTKWAIYLTNWGYTVCTVQAVLAAVMLSMAVLATRLRSMPKLQEYGLKMYPVYWIINTIATPLAFGITVMYWTVIYNDKQILDALNFLVHGNNSILMFIDLWMVSHPVRILHFLYPTALGLIYTIFSIIYYLAGGTDRNGNTFIYPILKWDQPLITTFVCLGVMAFLIFLHIIIFFLHKLRIKLYELKCLPRHDDGSTPDLESKKPEARGYDNEASTANDSV